MLFIFFPFQSFSQSADSLFRRDITGLPVRSLHQKNPGRAYADLVAAQVLPWAWNKLYRKKDFTNVSFSSIGRNSNPKNWRWDDNTFLMNQFVHPYHGSVYFNSFRANGYGFYASSAAAFAGSLLWEIAGENHVPAQNDLINTTLGGIAMGEIAARLSPIIVNNRQTGLIRQVREVLGFLVNPVNGWNRILDKKWGTVYQTNQAPPALFSLEMDAGSRRYNVKAKDLKKGKSEIFARMAIEYGDPYSDVKIPFSNFSAAVEIGTSDSATFNMARIKASLYGWKIHSAAPLHPLAIISMNYDYYRNTAFSYGAESFNVNLLSQLKLTRKTTLQTTLGGGLIALAAVPNDFLYYGEGRNYDYCSGVSVLTSGRLNIGDRISYRINYRHNVFATINGGNSTHRLNTTNSELKYMPGKNFFASFDWGSLILNSRYENRETTHRHYQYVRLSAGYKLSL